METRYEVRKLERRGWYALNGTEACRVQVPRSPNTCRYFSSDVRCGWILQASLDVGEKVQDELSAFVEDVTLRRILRAVMDKQQYSRHAGVCVDVTPVWGRENLGVGRHIVFPGRRCVTQDGVVHGLRARISHHSCKTTDPLVSVVVLWFTTCAGGC